MDPFPPSVGAWAVTEMAEPRPPPLGGSMSIDLGDGVLLTFGGYLASNSSLLFADFWLVDLASATGTRVNIPAGAPVPAPRVQGAVASDLAGNAYLVGGCLDPPDSTNFGGIYCRRISREVSGVSLLHNNSAPDYFFDSRYSRYGALRWTSIEPAELGRCLATAGTSLDTLRRWRFLPLPRARYRCLI
jgi:hypothetical protein